MNLSGFDSLYEVEGVLGFEPRGWVDIALERRNIMGRVAPSATKRIN